MRQELKGSGEAEAADATKEQRSGLALSPMQKPCTSCVIAWQRECVFVCARATYVYNTHIHTHTHTHSLSLSLTAIWGNLHDSTGRQPSKWDAVSVSLSLIREM